MAKAPVDLKRSAAEKVAGAMPMDMAEPNYPRGARIVLDAPELDKLGFANLPKADAELHLEGTARVVVSHQVGEDAGFGDQCRLELQITHLALEPARKSALAEMYGSSADAADEDK